MAQKPTIPSQYLPQPCGTSPRLTIFTSSSTFLYLIVTFKQPKRKPRFKTIRGLTYECGRQWAFEDAICIPQMNTPTNTYHIFPLPSANIGDCLWYSITTACRRDEATSFSPPIQYCYKACDPNGDFVQVEGLSATQLGSDYAFAYANVIAGNPACRINSVSLSPTADGDYAFNATAVVRADPNAPGNYTGELFFRRNDGVEFGISAPFSTDRGQEIAVAASGSIWMDAAHFCSIQTRRTAGTNLLQRPASLNAGSQWSMTPM